MWERKDEGSYPGYEPLWLEWWCHWKRGFPGGPVVKNRLPNPLSLGWEDPLEKEMATHSSILAWGIPQTEEPGGLQPMESQRVGHNSATKPPPSLTKVRNWRGSSVLERGLRFRDCFCLQQSELVMLVKHSREDVLEWSFGKVRPECKGLWQRLAEILG